VQDDAQPVGRQLPHRQTGNFDFKSILPVSYSIPFDGAAGQLLRTMGRIRSGPHTFISQ
jgi:hypothetical protein